MGLRQGSASFTAFANCRETYGTFDPAVMLCAGSKGSFDTQAAQPPINNNLEGIPYNYVYLDDSYSPCEFDTGAPLVQGDLAVGRLKCS